MARRARHLPQMPGCAHVHATQQNARGKPHLGVGSTKVPLITPHRIGERTFDEWKALSDFEIDPVSHGLTLADLLLTNTRPSRAPGPSTVPNPKVKLVRTSIVVPSRARRAPALGCRTAIPLLCFFLCFGITIFLIATRPYPDLFDELEHVSYAAFLQETGRLLPKFEAQRVLREDDMGRWGDQPNYLGHPSPFYLYLGLFLVRSLPPDEAVLPMRVASAGLLLAGIAGALAAGRRHFGGDGVALLVFCAVLALCPKLLAVAGQITNDTLAILGGGLAYWGASTEGRRHWLGLAGIAVGLLLALWAKPNAGLAVGTWLAAFSLLQARRRPGLLFFLALGVMGGAVPYLFIVADYNALVPVTAEQFGHVRQLHGFAPYVAAFLFTLGYTWCFVQTGTWPIPNVGGFAASVLCWAMIAGAAAGGLLAWRRARTGAGAARAAIAVAAPVAMAIVLPIHFFFAATKLGYSLPGGFLPLLPAAVAPASTRSSLWRRFRPPRLAPARPRRTQSYCPGSGVDLPVTFGLAWCAVPHLRSAGVPTLAGAGFPYAGSRMKLPLTRPPSPTRRSPPSRP